MDHPWNNQINFSTSILLKKIYQSKPRTQLWNHFIINDIYKTYKNHIVTLTRTSKNNHYSQFFSVHATNITKVWEGIREIIGSNSKSSIRVDDHLTTDPKVVANVFNDFFTSIADTVCSNIGPANRHFSHYLKNRIWNSIFLDRVNPAEVLLIINSLPLNKSSGPNSTPQKSFGF